MSSAVKKEICAITSRIKKYITIIWEKQKKHDKIVLLGKGTLNAIEILNSEALIHSYIIHDEFVSVHNALWEYYEMKKKSWNFCGIYNINVADISRKTYEKMV